MSFNETCSVCLEDFGANDKTTILSCGHTFHVDCIITCLRKSNECPNCRDTAGNPVSKTYEMPNFIWMGTDSEATDDQDYEDFLECMKVALKNNKELAEEIRDYKKECKLFEKKTKDIDRLYDKTWQKSITDFKKGFNEDVNYKQYLADKQTFTKRRGVLKRLVKKQLEKTMDIPKDANGEFVNKYIEDMADTYIFSPF